MTTLIKLLEIANLITVKQIETTSMSECIEDQVFGLHTVSECRAD